MRIEKKLNKVSPILVARVVFFALLGSWLMGSLIFFDLVVKNLNVRILPVIGNIVLLATLPLLNNRFLKEETIKVVLLGGGVMAISWFKGGLDIYTMLLYNLYGVVYALFFSCYLRLFMQPFQRLYSFTSVVNFFMFFCFLLYNAHFISHHLAVYGHIEYFYYLAFSIKLIILFLAGLTMLCCVVQTFRGRLISKKDNQDLYKQGTMSAKSKVVNHYFRAFYFRMYRRYVRLVHPIRTFLLSLKVKQLGSYFNVKKRQLLDFFHL
ncbi:hypothetical protein [Myroides pelagicus]|uniref:Uncharacterized protein n=1 Tax=Myroides pelagicus TaxID=270914 RepID=A0A7K1GS59_9FLAO|nr:hypothetical protein [Myroides pelagicus]MTH30764.1 hypothetical protein [Myroides pelagicus]